MKKSIFLTLFVLFLATMGFIAWSYLNLNEAQRLKMGAEDGPIETFHAYIFMAASALGLITAWIKRSRLWGVFTFLMAAATAREFDMHKEFTTDSILKIRFYTGDAAPMIEKIGGAVFVIGLLFSAIYLISRLFKDRHRLSLNNFPLVMSLCGFGALGFAKMLDSFARLFPGLIEFHHENGGLFRMAEETIETTAATLFLAAVSYTLMRRT